MSVHVLLNSLNGLKERDKMRGLSILDSVYHMTSNFINIGIFCVKRQYFDISYATLQWTSLCNVLKYVNH